MNNLTAALISAAIAFIVTALLGIVLIPVLHKLKFGQNILTDIGPKWHAKKQGTPTMGGILFMIGIVVSLVATIFICKAANFNVFSEMTQLKNNELIKLVACVLLALCCALIGFVDDYVKVKNGRNLGLTEMQKTIPQIVVIVAFLATLSLSGNTAMIIPFFSKISLDSTAGLIFFYLFGVLVIYGTVNAVNLTDGLDGLCASVTLPVGIAFAVMAAMYNMTSVSLLGAALVGGCAGYLVWNHYPAKVMMGDTGSMFLGGLIAALAYAVDCPLILVAVGIIYVAEALSDIVQVVSIKFRGQKVFRMAPIHHHLELGGWSEKKIDVFFTVISTIGCAVGVGVMYLTLKNG